jgi:hypothetical protein
MSDKTRQAYVVFTGKTDIWFLKFLKKGFRHCFIILEDQEHWVTFDPLSSHTEIEIIAKNKNMFLPDWLISQKFKVIEAKFNDVQNIKSPMALMNCVESVKRILGIHSYSIVTPYQLFKYLKQNNKEKKHGKLI